MTKQPNSQVKTPGSDSHISAVVMRRVRIIHSIEPLLSTLVISAAIFIVALWGIGREVWVDRVLRNMPSFTNMNAVFHFYAAAFIDTRFIVQVLSVLVFATFIWFAYNFAKAVRGFVQFA